MTNEQSESVPRCPICSSALAYVEEITPVTGGEGNQILVPLASDVYRCAQHGLWRVFMSGDVVPLVEK